MATPRKRKPARKAARKSRPSKKSMSYAKTLIADKQVTLVKKSVAILARDISNLEQRLENGGAINMADVRKIVESANEMQATLTKQVNKNPHAKS